MIRSGLPSLSRSTSNRSGLPSPVVSATQTSGLPSPSVSAVARSTRSAGSLISTPVPFRTGFAVLVLVVPESGAPDSGLRTRYRLRPARAAPRPAGAPAAAHDLRPPSLRHRLDLRIRAPGRVARVLDRGPYAAPVEPWEAAYQDAAEVLGRALAGEGEAVAGAFDAVVSAKGMAGAYDVAWCLAAT